MAAEPTHPIDSDARSDEISLAELFDVVRRYAAITLAAMLIVGTATWWFVERRPDSFLSQARLLATQPDPAIAQLSGSVAMARPLDGTAYRSAALSRPLLTAASEMLARTGHPELDLTDLGDRLTVTATEARLSIQLTVAVRSANPETGALKANAIAEALVQWDATRAAESVTRVTDAITRQIADVDAQIAVATEAGDTNTLDTLQSVRSEAERNLTAARLAGATIAGNLEFLEPARAAEEPEPNRALLVAALAAIVAGFGLLVLALLRESLSNKLGGIDGVAAQSRKPVLGSFPIDPSGSRRLPPEAAGYLRSNLQFLVPPDHPLVVLVTSGVAGEGKTSVAAALAESYTRSDYRTLVVDADGRRPKLTKTLRADSPGTRPWLNHGEPDPDAVVTLALGRHRTLDVLGLPGPLSAEDCRLAGRAFGHLVERLRDRYDVIVVDSAPVLPVADTLALAPQASVVVGVVSLKEATRHSLRDTLAVLERVGANLVGLVVTHAPRKRTNGSGSYGYGYGYGEESQGESTPQRPSVTKTEPPTPHRAGHRTPPRAMVARPNTNAASSDPQDGFDDLLLIDDAMIKTDFGGQGRERGNGAHVQSKRPERQRG